MESHYHCFICGKLLRKWPGYTWHMVKASGRTICFCDGECQEIFKALKVPYKKVE